MINNNYILFYRTSGPYGCFSNFSRHPVFIWDKYFKTSEHAFQAAKFCNSQQHFEMVRNASSPSQAAKIGRNRAFPMRDDWEHEDYRGSKFSFPDYKFIHKQNYIFRVKDWTMYDVCLAKFSQNKKAKQTLLSTGDLPLIEDTSMSHDVYWGIDFSYTLPVGENKLGRILMLVREELRK